MRIHFAPLQGFTDHIYRKAHYETCGGVDEYHTPFLRWEKDGLRNKDLRDIKMENIGEVPTTPQLICNGGEELARLADLVEKEGHRRMDVNMGCPFAMQTKRGRGAALLSKPEKVEELVREMERRSEVSFSVKMRLGMEDRNEWKKILPILEGLPLKHITVHPRVGKQMYKGSVDMDAFEELMTKCKHPLVYNGDVVEDAQIATLEQRFPKLEGVMIGRGLLASPTLATEHKCPETTDDKDRLEKLWKLHDQIYEYATKQLQGESQVLGRLHSFWEYGSPLVEKKVLKRLCKSGTLRSYNEAMALGKRMTR